jgi:DNA-binding transcriptional ArsR family regulator
VSVRGVRAEHELGLVRLLYPRPTRYTPSPIGDGRWSGDPVTLLDRSTAQEYAAWFRALADPTRVQLLEMLARAKRPMSVGEIVSRLGLAQSTVSQHLKTLAEVRFVLIEAVGTARHYRVNDRCIAAFPSAVDVVMGRPAPPSGGCP